MQVVLKEEGVRHIPRGHKELQRMIALHGSNLSMIFPPCSLNGKKKR